MAPMSSSAANTVLTLMAHPDDAEILCGGVLSILRDLGWRVHIATATPGDCGSATLSNDEIAAVRRREGQAAAALLDGEYHCLERRDLEVFYDRDTLRDACALMRRVRPHLVITHSPDDYMVDHEQISLVARATCFNAPMPNAPAPPGTEPLDRIPHLYYADPVEGVDSLGQPVSPSIVVDITDMIERKAEVLAAHASQREWLREHHGLDEYIEGMKRWSRERGKLAGVDFAEGYRQHLGHAYPPDDLLREVLTPRVRWLGLTSHARQVNREDAER